MDKNRLMGNGILVISVLNLMYKLFNFIDLSILVSFLGILSYVLQIKKKHVYKTLQLIWIAAQIPVITISQDLGRSINEQVILNLAQLFEFPITFGLLYSSTAYNIGVNLIPLVYLAVFKIVVKDEYLQQSVTVFLDNEKSKIFEFSPFQAQIVDVKNDWYTAKLDEEIEINKSKLDLIRFKLKKGGFFKPNKERQFCEVKLASSIHGYEINETGFVK